MKNADKRDVQKEKAMRKKEKVKFTDSMSFKIILLVVAVGIICTAICDIFFMTYMKNVAKNLAENNLQDIAQSFGAELDAAIEQNPEMTFEDYEAILSNVSMHSAPSTYAYLLNEEGYNVYHPSPDRLGTHVENEFLCGIMDQIAAGKNPPQTGIGVSLYRGKMKYNSYYILKNNYLLNITSDQADILSFENDATIKMLLISVFNLTLFIILGYLFSRLFSKPLQELTALVERTSRRDFTKNVNAQKIKKRKDEIGAIARAISTLRGSLRDIVRTIDSAKDNMNNNMEQVVASSHSIDEMSTDNSSTTQNLASGMQEVSNASEQIQISIENMQSEAEAIQGRTSQGGKEAEEIMKRAQELKVSSDASINNAASLCSEIKEKTTQAIEDAKVVSKINDLTSAIMEISSQTSLLALNANIEAARAGEAGKGFAVVATEIGSLANQSSETVNSINNIVSEVHAVVDRMVETMKQSVDFLENTVISDYEQLKNVSIQYEEDASSFSNNMESIEFSVNSLKEAVDHVAEALNNISVTVSETTAGVENIAQKSADVVVKTSENNEVLQTCMDSLDTFKEIVDSFTLG